MLRAMKWSALCAAAMMVATPAAATGTGTQTDHGAVVQTQGAAVQQKTAPPPLNLSDAERTRIAKTIGGHDTDVSFALKTAKTAATFSPAVGKKIPKGLKGHPLPPPLTDQMPELKQYKYVKFKDDVLIVNPMNKKIVDLFPLVQ